MVNTVKIWAGGGQMKMAVAYCLYLSLRFYRYPIYTSVCTHIT